MAARIERDDVGQGEDAADALLTDAFEPEINITRRDVAAQGLWVHAERLCRGGKRLLGPRREGLDNCRRNTGTKRLVDEAGERRHDPRLWLAISNSASDWQG
ncbi:MAG: hypothetical protein EPO23_03460 [Xanthobacteraceae bacterium]|nr:MAG: hypothetical protein EPO23_03460 [Xanthobacteraceae bacterium]